MLTFHHTDARHAARIAEMKQLRQTNDLLEDNARLRKANASLQEANDGLRQEHTSKEFEQVKVLKAQLHNLQQQPYARTETQEREPRQFVDTAAARIRDLEKECDLWHAEMKRLTTICRKHNDEPHLPGRPIIPDTADSWEVPTELEKARQRAKDS